MIPHLLVVFTRQLEILVTTLPLFYVLFQKNYLYKPHLRKGFLLRPLTILDYIPITSFILIGHVKMVQYTNPRPPATVFPIPIWGRNSGTTQLHLHCNTVLYLLNSASSFTLVSIKLKQQLWVKSEKSFLQELCGIKRFNDLFNK